MILEEESVSPKRYGLFYSGGKELKSVWNPWHGCRKVSAGCMNCYVYRIDRELGKDSSVVEKTSAFDYPVKRDRYGEYKLKADSPVYVCLSSDFFIEDADQWRDEIWKMIKERDDIHFRIITKRIERLSECVPEDWGEGYDNVTVICTCENQEMTDKRLPVFLEMPVRHREIIHEPMLENIDISRYLESGKIERVSCGGESGENARVCDYDWVINTRNQCVANNVTFIFRQTGANFIKGGRLYHIPRDKQLSQAEKAGINFQSFVVRDKRKKAKIQKYFAEDHDDPFNSILLQLSKSPFHNEIYLTQKEKKYYLARSREELRKETEEIIRKSLEKVISPEKDSHTRQWGHPAYVAQRATACCCRKCLYQWHNIPTNRRMTENEVRYVVDLLMEWMKRDML